MLNKKYFLIFFFICIQLHATQDETWKIYYESAIEQLTSLRNTQEQFLNQLDMGQIELQKAEQKHKELIQKFTQEQNPEEKKLLMPLIRQIANRELELDAFVKAQEKNLKAQEKKLTDHLMYLKKTIKPNLHNIKTAIKNQEHFFREHKNVCKLSQKNKECSILTQKIKECDTKLNTAFAPSCNIVNKVEYQEQLDNLQDAIQQIQFTLNDIKARIQNLKNDEINILNLRAIVSQELTTLRQGQLNRQRKKSEEAISKFFDASIDHRDAQIFQANCSQQEKHKKKAWKEYCKEARKEMKLKKQ